jgi:hypothetical protein
MLSLFVLFHHHLTRLSFFICTLLVLFWRREVRTVGSSKGCFLTICYLKNTYDYTDNYAAVNKKLQLSLLFLIPYLGSLNINRRPTI